jgi:hypothetical protein
MNDKGQRCQNDAPLPITTDISEAMSGSRAQCVSRVSEAEAGTTEVGDWRIYFVSESEDRSLFAYAAVRPLLLSSARNVIFDRDKKQTADNRSTYENSVNVVHLPFPFRFFPTLRYTSYMHSQVELHRE